MPQYCQALAPSAKFQTASHSHRKTQSHKAYTIPYLFLIATWHLSQVTVQSPALPWNGIYYQVSKMTNAAKVNRSFTEKEKERRKHLFWERRRHTAVLNTNAQSGLMWEGEISTHQFCPERHSAAELITDYQSVSSVQTVSVMLDCWVLEKLH